MIHTGNPHSLPPPPGCEGRPPAPPPPICNFYLLPGSVSGVTCAVLDTLAVRGTFVLYVMEVKCTWLVVPQKAQQQCLFFRNDDPITPFSSDHIVSSLMYRCSDTESSQRLATILSYQVKITVFQMHFIDSLSTTGEAESWSIILQRRQLSLWLISLKMHNGYQNKQFR